MNETVYLIEEFRGGEWAIIDGPCTRLSDAEDYLRDAGWNFDADAKGIERGLMRIVQYDRARVVVDEAMEQHNQTCPQSSSPWDEDCICDRSRR